MTALSRRVRNLTDQSTNGSNPVQERLAIAGTGAIACGLAATAARHSDVVLWARSPGSQDRARASVEKVCGKLEEVDASRVNVTGDLDSFGEATFVVEAIVEEHDAKAALLERINAVAGADAVLGTTTSSLSVG